MNNKRLLSIRNITGRIVVETGLRIGGSAETMEISGLDNPIIRNPADDLPFIPGSSLRGRMRSLVEWYFGEISGNGNVLNAEPHWRSSQVFGLPARDPKGIDDPQARAAYQRGPTRLIVRDCPLTAESRQRQADGYPITEVKSENSINRLTSMANPRPMERVLPGVSFDCELVYRVFDIDGDGGRTDRENFEQVVLVGLALVQADALGGASSRGCGKIRFENLLLDGQPLELPSLQFAAA